MTRYFRMLGLLALLASASAFSQEVYSRFQPANGVLKGNTGTYVTTPALSSDIVAMWTGTCTGTNVLQANGVCGAGGGGGGSPANPTGTIGLTAVNGSLSTFLRSDGAPPLSQAIAPTWTGAHTFTGDSFSTHATGFNLSAQANIGRITGISAGSQSMNAIGVRNANANGYSTIRLVNDLYSPGAFAIPTSGICCDDTLAHQFVIAFFGSTATGGAVFNGQTAGEGVFMGTTGAVPLQMGTFAHANEFQMEGHFGTFILAPSAGYSAPSVWIQGGGGATSGIFALQVDGGNTGGQANGVQINAGTGTSDAALDIFNSTVQRLFRVRGDGQIISKAPAQFGVQNMQSGAAAGWSLTGTGFTTDPVNFNSGITQSAGITCVRFNPQTYTSNSASFSITGFPSGITGAGEGTIVLEDNGTTGFGTWSFDGTTLTFSNGAASGTAFTATGTKGIPGASHGQTICWQAN